MLDTEQMDEAYGLVEDLSALLKSLVDRHLEGTDPEIEEFVRSMLTDQMRFWKEKPAD